VPRWVDGWVLVCFFGGVRLVLGSSRLEMGLDCVWSWEVELLMPKEVEGRSGVCVDWLYLFSYSIVPIYGRCYILVGD
jgi:hypothetical protein